jgi:hypothetical protein
MAVFNFIYPQFLNYVQEVSNLWGFFGGGAGPNGLRNQFCGRHVTIGVCLFYGMFLYFYLTVNIIGYLLCLVKKNTL